MRLELKSPGISKFWDIALDGRKLTLRAGKIGTDGQTKEEEFPTLTAARDAYDAQVAEKLKKGYQMAPGQLPIVPTGKVDPHLERMVQLKPDDETAALVLADALTEVGDPRGELISVQHALSVNPTDPKLQAREKKLLSAFGLPDPEHCELTWRWGFVKTAYFHNSPATWDDPHFDAVGLARDVFMMPMAMVLQQLELGMLRWDNQSEDVPALLKEAAKYGWAPRLRRLHLGKIGTDIDMAHHSVGDVSVISKAFPGLHSLFIHTGEFALTKLELPLLRELTIETCSMSQQALRAVTDAELPALERLELWFGSANYGADVGADHLSAILNGRSFPNVKHLGMRNAEFTDALCEAMLNAGILPQLKVLDLSMGTMSDAGAYALAKKPGAFAHLEALDVGDNFLNIAGREALMTLGCPILSNGQKSEQDDDQRYVSVGE